MKRLLAIAMCLALVLTSFVFASADTVDATITVVSVDGPVAEGDEVAIAIEISEWSNAYATIALELVYDESLLELDAIEQTGFSGALSSGNENKFSLIAAPSSDRAAKKVAGGEICVAYFYAATDINTSTPVDLIVKVNGYTNGSADNWVESHELSVAIERGGVIVPGIVLPPIDGGDDEHTCAPTGDIQYDENDHWFNCETVGCGNQVNKAPHEGGTATCTAKAVCSVCGASYGSVNSSNHVGGTEVRNEKVASCYESGYTGDTYCLGCDKKISNGSTIPATGAHVPGEDVEYNDTHHWFTCSVVGCGSIVEKTPHEGGEATCSAKKECTVCGAEYGAFDANNHKDTVIQGKENATCGAAGYTGNTYCNDCKKVVTYGQTIPATGAHTGGTATCCAKAVCSVCGTSYGNVDSSNHDGGTEVRNEKVASCYESGYTGDTYCLGCDKKISNGSTIPATGAHIPGEDVEYNDTHHWFSCSVVGCGNLVEKALHEGGTATCVAKKECTVCGAEYGNIDALNHAGETEVRNFKAASCFENGYTGDTYCLDCGEKITTGKTTPTTGAHIPGEDVEYNDTHHWFACSVVGCGSIVEKTPHEGGEATCSAKKECTVCGASYGAINANNHKDTVLQGAESATCGTAGYTGNTYCNDCQKVIAYGQIIPATGAHKGGEATCCAKAVCSQCSQAYGEVDVNNHDGETEVRGKNEVYTGDTYCLGCEKMIAKGEAIVPDLPDVGDAVLGRVTVSSVTGIKGDKVTVTVSIGEDTVMGAYGATLVYDETALKLVDMQKGDFCAVVNLATKMAGGYAANDVAFGTLFTATFEILANDGSFTVDVDFDENSTKKADLTPVVVSVTKGIVTVNCEHNHLGEIQHNDTHHWYVCDETIGCGNVVEKALHEGGEATCSAKAECSVCGAEYGAIDASNHKNTKIINANVGNCGVEGYTGDTYCNDCDKIIAYGEVISASDNHEGGSATCCTKAVCDVCGQEYGEFDANVHLNTEVRDDAEADCGNDG